MTSVRALLFAAAAMLATGCGALGLHEARAPLTLSVKQDCPQHRHAAARLPSAQTYQALMP